MKGGIRGSRGYGHALVERFPIEQCLRVEAGRRSDPPVGVGRSANRIPQPISASTIGKTRLTFAPGCHRCSLGRITEPRCRVPAVHHHLPRLCISFGIVVIGSEAKIRTEDAQSSSRGCVKRAWLADALERVRVAVAPGVRTIELDEDRRSGHSWAEQPRHSWATTGTGINLCFGELGGRHGNPRRVLEDDDLVSIDCGAIVDGWHGDTRHCRFPVGEITLKSRTCLR